MNTADLKTINDLLETTGYPFSFIQGHHTRIVKANDGKFGVYSKDNDDSYTISRYIGFIEELAVKAYVKSEIDE